MSTEPNFNIEALTAPRQLLLSNALSGHSLEMGDGKLSETSRESLSVIGLTPIEINALEQTNATGAVGKVSLKVLANATPSSENNPFAKEKWDTDKQRLLHDSDPVMARKLMKEAGLLS